MLATLCVAQAADCLLLRPRVSADTAQVWVPYGGPGSVDGELPDRLSDAAFDELASKAAGRAAAQRQKQQQPYSPPDW